MRKKILKAIVVGVGNMGQHHARVYNQHPNINLVAVVDKNKRQAKKIADKLKTKFYADIKQCLKEEKIDVASLALPPQLNYKIAPLLLDKKIHLLIEKPLALDIKTAKQIIQAVKKNNVRVAVGHIEHFNPAVQSAKKIIDGGLLGKIKYISAKRIGMPAPHLKKMNVIWDIGVHDLEVFNYLTNQSPKNIKASGRHALEKEIDVAVISLDYGGILTNLEVNKICPIKKRTLEIFGDCGYLTMDYILQTVNFYPLRQTPSYKDFKQFISQYNSTPGLSKIKVKKVEPLKAEIDDFIKAVIMNHPPQVTPEKALEVIKIADTATRAIS